jgi:serine/threonine protein phosphatase PrpC
MRAAARTHVGKVRKVNEDTVFVDLNLGLLLVADGMGGYSGGEIASALAVGAVVEFLREKLPGASGEEETERLICEAVGRAEQAIRERAEGEAELAQMGTTMVLALARGPKIHLAHLGDSRAYRIRSGEIRCLTRDHSLVNEMLEAGQITPREARRHPLRNVVTRSLGLRGYPVAELQVLDWQPGDTMLLCSDGLNKMVEDKAIHKAVVEGGDDLAGICETLIKMANGKGGRDNISVIVARQD